tara:strand:+ start:23071 stop:23472 length:402 start_codon:yes stop_codon:yes gene_type:complete
MTLSRNKELEMLILAITEELRSVSNVSSLSLIIQNLNGTLIDENRYTSNLIELISVIKEFCNKDDIKLNLNPSQLGINDFVCLISHLDISSGNKSLHKEKLDIKSMKDVSNLKIKTVYWEEGLISLFHNIQAS